MKYWRGYLTAAILLACTWALREFAKAHSLLVDMIYPYVTRMAQEVLVSWSGGVTFCLWSVLLTVFAVVVIATAVLMVIFKWNPIRWCGWVCAAVAVVVFLNFGLLGLNQFSGNLSEDIRLEETDYTITELTDAAVYYRDLANALADEVPRDNKGDVKFEEFDILAAQAADGFEDLVYDQSLSVFAGPMTPVKQLCWEDWFTARGVTGLTVALTGEAAVNAATPAVLLPFAMCREMAHRSSIAIEKDASFAAYLACKANESLAFRYSGALMGYRYCLMALKDLDQVTGAGSAKLVAQGENENLDHDLSLCDDFLKKASQEDAKACDLLTSWHIQEVVLPGLMKEEQQFNPLDKTQVDLSDHPNA